jgi:hypothetical protein
MTIFDDRILQNTFGVAMLRTPLRLPKRSMQS